MNNPKSNVNLSDSTAGDSKNKIIRTMDKDLQGVKDQVTKELESQKIASASEPLSMPPAAAQMKKPAGPAVPPPITGSKSPIPPVPVSSSAPQKPSIPPPKPPIAASKISPPLPPKPDAVAKIAPPAPKKSSVPTASLLPKPSKAALLPSKKASMPPAPKKEDLAGEIKIPEKEKKSSLKFALILGGTLIVVAGLVGGLYFWKKTPKKADTTPTTPDTSVTPVIPPPELPVSVISSKFDEQIKISGADANIILQELSNRADQPEASESFRRILIMLSTKSEKRYLPLTETLQVLRVNVPSVIQDNLGEEHTMFFYGQNNEGRLGLISRVKDAEAVAAAMLEWESGVKKDLEFMFLGKQAEFSSEKSFLNNDYKGVKIRYINLPTSELTIDYAVIPDQNFLIIATSKESMYRVIDDIVK